MSDYPHILGRVFNTPLAITRKKAEIIQTVMAKRLDLTALLPQLGQTVDARSQSADVKMGGDGRYQLLDSVAIIPITGTLVHKASYLDTLCGFSGYTDITDSFVTALEDPAVAAIVFDCDSPGGEVSGCFDLVDLIYEARGEKPMYSILSECAYSAAYAIASAADEITVPRTGGVGSIGVICMHADFSQQLADEGVKVTIIQYGDRKSDGNDVSPLSDQAHTIFQAEVDAMGELFVETVARNRDIAASKVRGTQAATFMGSAGVEIGLADDVQSPAAAIGAVLATYT